jgi:hypothetical protein
MALLSSWFQDPPAPCGLPEFLRSAEASGATEPAPAIHARAQATPAASRVPRGEARKRARDSAARLDFLTDTALGHPNRSGRCRVLLDGLIFATPYNIDELCSSIFSAEDRKQLFPFVLQSDEEIGWLETSELAGVLVGSTRVPIETARALVRLKVDLTARPMKAMARRAYAICMPYKQTAFMITLLPTAELLEGVEERAANASAAEIVTTAEISRATG